MIRIFITAVLYLISLFTQAQENSKQGFQQSIEPAVTINSNVNYLMDSKETVYFPLYVSEKEYTISCYHDKNDNAKMDFDINGMPLEVYGFTYNMNRFGPQGLMMQNL